MRKLAQIIAAAAVLAGASSAAEAATASANFNVKVKIAYSCTVSATDVDFGTIVQFAGGETATGTVTVNCSNTLPYTLSLDTPALGQKMSGTAPNLQTINYTLALGSTSGTGTGVAQSINLNGAVPTPQFVVPDDYKQARTVTITY